MRLGCPHLALGLGLALVAVAAVSGVGCYGGEQVDAGAGDASLPDSGEPADALFQRLGGEPGIEVIVAEILDRADRDPKINGYFLNTTVNRQRFTTCLAKQLAALAGGPRVYPARGEAADADGCRNMREAHRGLGISTLDLRDFDATVVTVLASRGVAQADREAVVRALSALSDDVVESPRGDETIYLRARRRPGLQAIVDDVLAAVLADPKINGYFLNSSVDAARLSTCLVRQLCQATGGPCRYREELLSDLYGGAPCKPMLDAHRGLGVSAADFTDFTAHLVEGLRAHGMPKADVDAIVRQLMPLAGDVVEDSTSAGSVYQRLGRKPAIERVVRDFLARASADPKINGYFLNDTVDGGRLGTCLVRHLCQATGGPCRYGEEAAPELPAGGVCRNLTVAHRGLGASSADFSDFAADLAASFTASSAVSQRDLALVVAALGSHEDEVVEDDTSRATIYQRAGRKPALQAIIGDFVGRVVGDATLVGFFTQADAGRLGTCLVRQLCEAGGGPCKYGHEAGAELLGGAKCRDMASSHQRVTSPPGGGGRGITRADFDALVGHLVEAMTASGAVSPADRTAIVDALAPLCAQIVAGGQGC